MNSYATQELNSFYLQPGFSGTNLGIADHDSQLKWLIPEKVRVIKIFRILK